MRTSLAAALLVAFTTAHAAGHSDDSDHEMKPYSRDYYAAHACEHATWDLQDRIDAVKLVDLVQNVDISEANGTIQPYQD